MPLPAEFWDNILIVLGLVYTIWIYGWAKKQLGNWLLAILFSVVVVYLTFFQFPFLIWIPAALFLFQYFFRGFFEKIPAEERKPDYLRD